MNWITFFTGFCGVYAITGATAAIKSSSHMVSKYLTCGEKSVAALIFASWVASVAFMVWRVFILKVI